jgi:hypothetical protein
LPAGYVLVALTMKRRLALLFVSAFFLACGTTDRDEALSKVIRDNVVLSDSVIHYEFKDTSTLVLTFTPFPQFERYRVGAEAWMEEADGNDYLAFDSEGVQQVENNQITLKNLDLKGKNPDSLLIKLWLSPQGLEFIDREAHVYSTYYLMNFDHAGQLKMFSPWDTVTVIDHNYLHHIDDDEIRKYCIDEVQKRFRKLDPVY